jgi:phage/plasmid-associated DNA primase
MPCPICGREKGCSVDPREDTYAVTCVTAVEPSVVADGRVLELAKRGGPNHAGLMWSLYVLPGSRASTQAVVAAADYARRKVEEEARKLATIRRTIGRLLAAPPKPEVTRKYLIGRGIPADLLRDGLVRSFLLDRSSYEHMARDDGSATPQAAMRAAVALSMGVDGEVAGDHWPTRVTTPCGTVEFVPASERRAWSIKRTCTALVVPLRGLDDGDGTPSGRYRAMQCVYLDPADDGRKRPADAKKSHGVMSGVVFGVLDGPPRRGAIVVGEGPETVAAVTAATGLCGLVTVGTAWMARLRLPDAWLRVGDPASVRTVIVCEDADGPKPIGGLAGQHAAVECAGSLAAQARELGVDLRVVIRSPARLWADAVETESMWHRPNVAVDWLDAVASHGEDAVRSAVLDGVELDSVLGHAAGGGQPPRPPHGLATQRGSTGGGGDDTPPHVASGDGDGDAGDGGTAVPAPLPGGAPHRARRFLLDMLLAGDRFRLARTETEWWYYTGARWETISDDRLIAMIMHWLDTQTREHRGRVVEFEPEEKHARNVLKALMCDTWVEMDEVPCWLPPSIVGGTPKWASVYDFDRQADPPDGYREPRGYVGYRNGLLDVEALVGGEVVLREHTPRLLHRANLPYAVDAACLQRLIDGEEEPADVWRRRCPSLMHVLDGAFGDDAESREVFQRALGMTVTYDRRWEKVMMCIGPKRAGKGCLINAVVSVLGKESVAMTGISAIGDKFELDTWMGKRAALIADGHVTDYAEGRKAVEVIKTISGNDPVRLRGFMKAPRSFFRLPVQFWVYVNEMPDLRDPSGAYAGRLVLLKMRRSFFGREDETLKPRILTEGVGNSLFAWLGYFMARNGERRGLWTPTASAGILDEMRDRSAPIVAFLADRCELYQEACHAARAAGTPLPKPDLYRVRPSVIEAEYERWAASTGRRPLRRQAIGAAMPSLVHGFEVVDSGRDDERRDWFGLRLKPGATPLPAVAGRGSMTETWSSSDDLPY